MTIHHDNIVKYQKFSEVNCKFWHKKLGRLACVEQQIAELEHRNKSV